MSLKPEAKMVVIFVSLHQRNKGNFGGVVAMWQRGTIEVMIRSMSGFWIGLDWSWEEERERERGGCEKENLFLVN